MSKGFINFLIGTALLFMIAELCYINSLSLLYLVHKQGAIHGYFAIIGAVAWSIVTIIVMVASEEKWPKMVFPVFDALLVFCGFNLEYYNSMAAGTDNTVRLVLTIILAAFTGFITYCLGIINYEKYAKTDIDQNESKIKELVSKLDVSQNEFYKLKSDFNKSETELRNTQSHFRDCKTDFETSQTELKLARSENEKLKTDLAGCRKSHLLAEKSRILKKRQDNRTAEEIKVLEECESFN